MKIAIVGAGFAGLSLAWHLLEQDANVEVSVYDPKSPIERASSLAFLLHPFINAKANLNWKGREALSSAFDLLEKISEYSQTTFYQKRPFLKLANHPSKVENYRRAATLYPDLKWIEKTVFKVPGLWVENAGYLNSALYLEVLQKACLQKGVVFISAYFDHSKPHDYDKVVLANGFSSSSHPLLSTHSFSKVKGQILKVEKPKDFKLDYPITAHKCHIIPSIDGKSLILGSTYERNFQSIEPNLNEAFSTLKPHLNFILPDLKEEDVLEVKSGIRLNAPNRLPLIGSLDDQTWVFSALGSKGLLYHAYLGELLAQALLQNTNKELPQETIPH